MTADKKKHSLRELTRSDDSAMLTQGETAIVTSENGPIGVKLQHMNVEKMQDLGGLVACAINAVCLALMNSSIEMKYLGAAMHSILREDGEIVLDPDALQSKDARAKYTFELENCTKNTVSIYTHGKFTTEHYHRTLRMSTQAVAKVFDFYGAGNALK